MVGSDVELLSLRDIESLCAVGVEMVDELLDRLRFLRLVAEIGVKHLLKRPLCPMVVVGGAGAHLAVPVEGETYLVELFAVAVDILEGGLLRMLTGLYGILLCGQTVGIVAHRIEHIETLLPFIASVDVACDVSQRMAHVQAGATGVGKHI